MNKNTGKLKMLRQMTQDHVAVQLKALPPILEMQKNPQKNQKQKKTPLNQRY